MGHLWRRLGLLTECGLYVLFIADCFALLANVGGDTYDPTGGASLIVLLLAAGAVRRLRGGSPAP